MSHILHLLPLDSLSVLRHPSYFGWFYWSLGTQIFLCNPICAVFYTYASWSFFSTRIPYEESLLQRFYPQQYAEYASRTVILIPFVRSHFSGSTAGPSTSSSIASSPNSPNTKEWRLNSCCLSSCRVVSWFLCLCLLLLLLICWYVAMLPCEYSLWYVAREGRFVLFWQHSEMGKSISTDCPPSFYFPCHLHPYHVWFAFLNLKALQ